MVMRPACYEYKEKKMFKVGKFNNKDAYTPKKTLGNKRRRFYVRINGEWYRLSKGAELNIKYDMG